MSLSTDQDTTIVVSQLMSVWQVKLLLTEEPELCDLHYEIPLTMDVAVSASPTLLYPDQQLSELGISSRKSRGSDMLTLYVEYYSRSGDSTVKTSIASVDEQQRAYGDPFDYSSVNANDQFPQRVVKLSNASGRACGAGMLLSDIRGPVVTKRPIKSRESRAVVSAKTTRVQPNVPFFLVHSDCRYSASTLANIPAFPSRTPVVDGLRILSVFLQSTEYSQWRQKQQPVLPSHVQSLNLALSFPLPCAVSGMVPVASQPFSLRFGLETTPCEQNKKNQTLGIAYGDPTSGVPSDLACFSELKHLDASTCETPLSPYGVLPALTSLSMSCSKKGSSLLFPLPVCGNLDARVRVDDLALYINKLQTQNTGTMSTEYVQEKLVFTPPHALLQHVDSQVMDQMVQLDSSRYLNSVWRILLPFTPQLAHCNYVIHPTGDYPQMSQVVGFNGHGMDGGDELLSPLTSPVPSVTSLLAEGRGSVVARTVYRQQIHRAFKHVPYLLYFGSICARRIKEKLSELESQDTQLDDDHNDDDDDGDNRLRPVDASPVLSSPSALEKLFVPVGVPPYLPALPSAESQQAFLAELALQKINDGREQAEEVLRKAAGAVPPQGGAASGQLRGLQRELQLTEAIIYSLPRPTLQLSVGFSKLQKLNLSYNRVTPASVLQQTLQPALEELDLSFNSLEFLPADLSGFRRLRLLNLSGNHLAGEVRASDSTGDAYNRFAVDGTPMSNLGSHGYAIVDDVITAATSPQPLLDSWNSHQTRQLLVYQALGTISSLEELDLSHNHFTFFPVQDQQIPRCQSSISADSDIQQQSHDWTHGVGSTFDGGSQPQQEQKQDEFEMPVVYRSPFMRLKTLRLVCNSVDSENRLRGLLDQASLRWVDLRGNDFTAELEESRLRGHWRTVTPFLYSLSNAKGVELVVTNARLNSTGVIVPSPVEEWHAPVSLFSPQNYTVGTTSSAHYTFATPSNISTKELHSGGGGGGSSTRRNHPTSTTTSYNALERLLAVETEDITCLLTRSESSHSKNRTPKTRKPITAVTMSSSHKLSESKACIGKNTSKTTDTRRYTRNDVFHAAIDSAIDNIEMQEHKNHKFYHVTPGSEPWNVVPSSARVTGTDILHGTNTVTRRKLEEQQRKASESIHHAQRSESRLTVLRRAERDQQHGQFVLKTQNSTLSEWAMNNK